MAIDDASARRARFEALYRAHVMDVRRFCARRSSSAAAEDAVAETFTVLWRRLEDAPEDPRLWLLSVARRVIANQARGARRRLALRERLAERAAPGAEPPPAESHDAELAAALAGLRAAEREALVLVHWDGLTPTEAAAVAGCTAVAMRSRLHRAHRRLRSALGAPERANPIEEHPWQRTA